MTCRLVLTVFPEKTEFEKIEDALSGGDVASVFLFQNQIQDQKNTMPDTRDFQEKAAPIVDLAHGHDVAVIIADDAKTMTRTGADGLMLSEPDLAKTEHVEIFARFSPKYMLGCGGIDTRHKAMEAAETGCDFLFIGKRDGPIRARAHPKNIELGAWCSQMINAAIIVPGGSAIESVGTIAQSGAEFAALGEAVFEHEKGCGEAVRHANEILADYSDG